MRTGAAICFAKMGTDRADLNLFLGPLSEEAISAIVWFESTDTLAHALAKAGLFPSVSEARRNGFGRPIPPGFSELRFSKHRRNLVFLNLEGATSSTGATTRTAGGTG